MPAKSPVFSSAVLAVMVVVLLVGLAGCAALGGRGDRVHVDANTVRAQLQKNGGIGRR